MMIPMNLHLFKIYNYKQNLKRNRMIEKLLKSNIYNNNILLFKKYKILLKQNRNQNLNFLI